MGSAVSIGVTAPDWPEFDYFSLLLSDLNELCHSLNVVILEIKAVNNSTR